MIKIVRWRLCASKPSAKNKTFCVIKNDKVVKRENGLFSFFSVSSPLSCMTHSNLHPLISCSLQLSVFGEPARILTG